MVFFVVIIFSPTHPFIGIQNDNVIINVNKKNSCTVQTKNCLLKWEYFAINFLSCYLLPHFITDSFHLLNFDMQVSFLGFMNTFHDNLFFPQITTFTHANKPLFSIVLPRLSFLLHVTSSM